MSAVRLILCALICLLVQSSKADDLPILHRDCKEYEDPFNPTQLPYPNDCTKFYKCSAGFAFPMNCPRGLHWSVSSNRCETPWVANCHPKTVTPSETVEPNSNSRSDGIANAYCPVAEDPYNPTHLAYPGDCAKFYKCEAGYAYPINCPRGLHWSVELNRCDWPTVAKCTSTSVPAPAPAPAPAQYDLDAYCNLKSTKIGYLSYPGDLSQYVLCSNGRGFAQNCPQGLQFNSMLNICS